MGREGCTQHVLYGVGFFCMLDRVPLKETVSTEVSAPNKPEDQKVFEKATSQMDDLDYHRVADFFDVVYEDRKLPDMEEKLGFLREWAKEQSGSEDRLEQMTALNALKKRLGINTKGKDLVKTLYKYARLDQDRRRIEKEMSLLT